MTKFSGVVGYSTGVETINGISKNTIVERTYFGDVLRDTKQWVEGKQLNDNLTVSNRISILADDFAYTNFSAMRYVKWSGVLWKVNNIENQRPRLILSLGGVYNGPTP
jgi:hypothetical protein